MSEIAYTLYRHLLDVPFNIWLYLLPLLAPLLVLWGVKYRVPKLLLAVFLTYALINMSLHTHYTLKRKAYDACQSQFEDGLIQQYPECKKYTSPHDSAPVVFYALLGWIPAASYTGLWEIVWWMLYRKRTKEKKWVKTIYCLRLFFLLCTVPIAVYILPFIFAVIRFYWQNH